MVATRRSARNRSVSPNKEISPKKSQSEEFHRETGTIERGHIYFFYRPKVETEEAHSLDDVKNLHILLVPRPPVFTRYNDTDKTRRGDPDADDMNLLAAGADVVPQAATENQATKKFRLVTVGKKQLPDPEKSGSKNVFWASVTAVGDDLDSLEQGLSEKTYETKTRGTRHNGPARLAGRGAYAIVNNDPRTPSRRKTHLGYHLSHPAEPGPVQEALNIHTASSFVLQVKNPLAPVTTGQRVGLPANRRADYPDTILDNVFGRSTKGRSDYGLRFTSCETIDLLDYEGAELLLIAAREGENGLEQSLGQGRGEALQQAGKNEGEETVNKVMKELGLDKDVFPPDALEGEWI